MLRKHTGTPGHLMLTLLRRDGFEDWRDGDRTFLFCFAPSCVTRRGQGLVPAPNMELDYPTGILKCADCRIAITVKDYLLATDPLLTETTAVRIVGATPAIWREYRRRTRRIRFLGRSS